MSKALTHPLLGEILPKSGDDVVQFLGLKYASLENAFAESALHVPEPGTIDASKHGPSVVSPQIACEMEFGLIQKSLELPEFTYSELDGLNLNITVPASISKDQKLPVFVFLHGGGFGIGGNSWPQYDLARFVQLSIEDKRPIVAININYRLGAFGFLTSKELRDAGYPGNNGLRDQRVAFAWIKKNISGFGGDPENISVGGESAGGISTTLHLYSKQPQFTRAISFGGTGLLMKPLPAFIHENTYTTVLEVLGIIATSAEDRVAALLATPAEDFLTKLPPGLPLHPYVDGDIIPVPVTFADISDPSTSVVPGKQWCRDLLIGDNELDASILIGAMEGQGGSLAKNFMSSFTKSLASHTGVAEFIFSAYKIEESLSNDEAVLPVLRFATDIGFLAPTLTYAKGWERNSYVYCFNEPNPWEGRFKGHSCHILDVAFLFQNYNDHLSNAQRQSAVNFAKDVIAFVNGQAPWTSFNSDNTVKVYGPSDGALEAVSFVLPGKGNDKTRRRGAIFQFVENPGLDVISNAFSTFLSGQ
ncbi:carboxylesterase [Phlyctema vagabunda]|uniref:Carboxylic ester hydrolase n=1 Tax=Phlyctema vagabunda TaxID=108571 RepID=A0ABR4PTL4_9HELO